MEIRLTCSQESARDPFYPFSYLVSHIPIPSEKRGRWVRSMRRAHPYLFRVWRGLRSADWRDGLVSALISERFPAVLSRFLRTGMVLILRQYHRTESNLYLTISNAMELPRAFNNIAEVFLAAGQEVGIETRIHLDEFADTGDGKQLPANVTVRQWREGRPRQTPCLDKNRPAAATRGGLLSILVSGTLDDYRQQLLELVLNSEVDPQVRETAVLVLSRSEDFGELVPTLVAGVRASGVPFRLTFVVHLAIGSFYYRAAFLDEAHRYFAEAHRCVPWISLDTPLSVELVRAFWISLGNLLREDRGRFSEVPEQCYFLALELPQRSEGEIMEIAALRGLAAHYTINSRFVPAERYLQAALERARRAGLAEEEFECLRLHGAFYERMGQVDRAVAALRTALGMARSEGSADSFAGIHNTLGYLYMTRGAWNTALSHYVEGVRFMVDRFRPSNLHEIISSLHNIVELALAVNHPQVGLRYAKLAYRLSDYFSSRRSVRHWNLIRSSRHLTQLALRVGAMGQARQFYQWFIGNLRPAEHAFNEFHRRQLEVLLERRFTEEAVREAIAPVRHELHDALHVQLSVVLFYLDLFRETHDITWQARARDVAREAGLESILSAHRQPPQLPWETVEAAVPDRLLHEYVELGRRFIRSQESLRQHTLLHGCSRRILDDGQLDEVLQSLFPVLRTNFETEEVFLYLRREKGYERVQEPGVASQPPPKAESVLNYAIRRLDEFPNGIFTSVDWGMNPGPLQGRSVLLVQLALHGERRGILVLGNPRGAQWSYNPDDLTILQSLADVLSLKMENLDQLAALRERSIIDDLTGTYNKRILDRVFMELAALNRRTGMPFSMMLLDGDDFKEINDIRGHLAGDEAIRHIAGVLTTTLRPYDRVIRFGGDEFCVFFPSTLSANARAVAERIRAALESQGPCTVSIGLAEYCQEYGTLDSFFRVVDEALYRAKGSKNRIELVKQPAPTEISEGGNESAKTGKDGIGSGLDRSGTES